ncbi:hypothetical protein [Pontibacter vulgaris]|uniref:hypothetical protein n=1 Tax=Pontibacter vulgaris TaxID=2905679 RepID=UPI001FA7C722|nr:hypothetical protein [Pontibacter vulgaris]
MKKIVLSLVLATAFIAGCDDKFAELDPSTAGYDYYPLEVGDYRIYDVTNIRFLHNVGDTTRFQMRELVDTTFIDQTNTVNYKIIRSIRADDNSEWQEDSVMVVTKSLTNVILTKDNTKYVKMVFPVKEGKKWAADMYNTHTIPEEKRNDFMSDRDPFKIKEPSTFIDVDKPYSVGGKSYTNTVTIIQGTPIDPIMGIDDRKEVYAKGIGRVYRIFNRATFAPCAPNQCAFGEQFKLDGHERHEVLVSYGKE